MIVTRARGDFCGLPMSSPLCNSFLQRFLAFSASLTSQLTHPICILLPGMRFFPEKILTLFSFFVFSCCKTGNYKLTAFLSETLFSVLSPSLPASPAAVLAFYFGKSPAFRLYFMPRMLSLYYTSHQRTGPHTTRLQPGGPDPPQGKARHYGRGNQRKT